MVGLFGITISPSLLDTGNPMVFGVLSISFLLIGCFIGWQVCKRRIDVEVKKAEAVERMRLEAKDAEKKREKETRRRELEERRIAFVEQLDYQTKEYLWRFYSEDYIDIPNSLRDFDDEYDLSGWVTYETVSRDKDRWRVSDWAREFLDSHPELLDNVASEHLEKGATGEPFEE